MTPIPATSPASGPSSAGPGRVPGDPAEAARQFEAVLVRQFVDVMTKDLFQGEEGGLLTGQADLQRDTLTDTLAAHLVDAGTFGIADLLLQQWQRGGRLPEAAPDAPPEIPAPAAPPSWLAQGRPDSIDPSPTSS